VIPISKTAQTDPFAREPRQLRSIYMLLTREAGPGRRWLPEVQVPKRYGRTLVVADDPVILAITPNGRTAYVANAGDGTVTPISTATNTAGKPIRVGHTPRAIAITPDGKTAYVVNNGSGTVTPISIVTDRADQPISVGLYPVAIAIAK
jgi:YVTN family beta-propeller protein